MKNIFDTITPIKQVTLTKNTYLFHQGDTVKFLFRIKEGQIRLLRLTLDGKESIMYEGGSGEMFAEPSLFSETYHCDAIAMQDSKLDVFEKKQFLATLMENNDLSLAYTAMLARQVQKLRTHVELRNVKSAHERVYQFLVLEADPSGQIVLMSSLKNLARQLGLAHETFYRALSKLEKAHLIQRQKDGGILLTAI